jgi:hypothetical protein
MKVLAAMAIITLLYLVYLAEMARFDAIRVYYPEMTFHEYCLVHDRLRITPDGD